MFTFIPFIHIKTVKSYAYDLTLIAATQIALFKKIIVYMEGGWGGNLNATLFTNPDQLIQFSHNISVTVYVTSKNAIFFNHSRH